MNLLIYFEEFKERYPIDNWPIMLKIDNSFIPYSGDLSDISAGGERSRRSRQLASLSIADVSPRLALQRILALFQV